MGAVLAILTASLLGSVHCAAMCGGLSCLYVDASMRRSPLPHALYHGGRLVAYAALGAIAGGLGGGVDRFAAAAGWARVAATAAGSLMIAYGIVRLGATLGLRLPAFGTGRIVGTPVLRVVGWARRRDPLLRAAVTGLATGMLPCGWLYAFVLTAAAAGSAASGAVVMSVFWVGTVPMLLAIGVGVQRGAGALGRRLPALAAGTLVVVGALTVAGRVTVDPLRAARSRHGAHGTMAAPPDAAASARHGVVTSPQAAATSPAPAGPAAAATP